MQTLSPRPALPALPVRQAALAVLLATAATAASAAATVQFAPLAAPVVVGQVFDLVLQGVSFDTTGNGDVIDNLSGGQKVDFRYSSASFELLSIAIDPRWSFTVGNKPGAINAAAGTVTGLSFAVFPATTDDNFNIATFTVRAIAEGQGTFAPVAGQFVGMVAGRAAQQMMPAFNQASIGVVPEPQSWALFAAGLACMAGVRLRVRSQVRTRRA